MAEAIGVAAARDHELAPGRLAERFGDQLGGGVGERGQVAERDVPPEDGGGPEEPERAGR